MKTLVISGGAQGIGAATVARFTDEGYFCYILDIKPPTYLLPHTQFLTCDLADNAQIEQAVQHILLQTPHIDALVCNAGIHLSATLQETSLENFEKVMQINFRGSFFLTKAILPAMVARKKGAIVFVGSDQTLIAKRNSAVYAASKAALGSLAKTTALDYAFAHIRSNLVAPGTINTPLYQTAVQRYSEKHQITTDVVHANEAAEQPLGRIGEAEEVAELIYFLCSDLATFITGSIYPIDGGYTAG